MVGGRGEGGGVVALLPSRTLVSELSHEQRPREVDASARGRVEGGFDAVFPSSGCFEYWKWGLGFKSGVSRSSVPFVVAYVS